MDTGMETTPQKLAGWGGAGGGGKRHRVRRSAGGSRARKNVQNGLLEKFMIYNLKFVKNRQKLHRDK